MRPGKNESKLLIRGFARDRIGSRATRRYMGVSKIWAYFVGASYHKDYIKIGGPSGDPVFWNLP